MKKLLVILIFLSSYAFGQHVSASNINNVFYVGSNFPQWSGSDIGAQINAAYAALPANGGRIVIVPKSNGGCYDFSTPIVFNTSGKYVLVEYGGGGGLVTSGITGVWSGCLNYTPTTATSAITLDYATSTNSSSSPVHGLKDVLLVNNNCAQSGGCGSSATGILVGTTNRGVQYGQMMNVGVMGFAVGFKNTNTLSSNVTWFNPQFWYNSAAFSLGSVAGQNMHGGNFQGNDIQFQAFDANSRSETGWFGTVFVAHGTSSTAFDYTNITTCCAKVDFYGVHFENGRSLSANAHYIDGKVNAELFGGLVDDDSTSGTADWWFNAVGDVFLMEDTELQSATRTPTIGVVNSATTTRVKVAPFVKNPAVLTTIVGGTGTVNATVMATNVQGTTAADWTFDSKLLAPNSIRMYDCSTTSTCAVILRTLPILVRGSVAFPTATTVTVTALPFTSAATYTCVGQDVTSAAGVINATTYTDGTSVTFTETGGANTDTMRYQCSGW